MHRPALRLAFLVPLLAPLVACGSVSKQALGQPSERPFSGAVLSGAHVFVSGKIGERGGSFAREVETAIDAVEKELAGAGLDLSDVVTATVYLTDMGRYGELNEIYARRFPAPYPARACVAVRELPVGAQVEIQVIAARR